MNELSLAPILSSLIYGTLGLVLFFITLFIMEKITPFSLEKKITEEGNIALAIVIASIVLSLGIIFATAIH